MKQRPAGEGCSRWSGRQQARTSSAATAQRGPASAVPSWPVRSPPCAYQAGVEVHLHHRVHQGLQGGRRSSSQKAHRMLEETRPRMGEPIRAARRVSALHQLAPPPWPCRRASSSARERCQQRLSAPRDTRVAVNHTELSTNTDSLLPTGSFKLEVPAGLPHAPAAARAAGLGGWLCVWQTRVR